MTQGKNPRNFKKKGGKKKTAHAFAKKEWYTVLAPSIFTNREACITPVTRSAGQKHEEDNLRGRVYEISLADLNKDSSEQSWRKMKLQVEEVKKDQKEVLTNFYGMDMTRDQLCRVIKKWQSTLEAFVDVKTQDGYFVRIFAIAFTQKRKTQLKATAYAKASQIKQIRGKMIEIMIQEAQRSTLKQLAIKFIDRFLEKRIAKECNKIYPLQNVYIKKVKMLKKPKYDLAKLMELYSEKPEPEAVKKTVDEAAAQNTIEEPTE